ncbi:MAG: cobalamin-dependent protein [Thaumarchaeota archaeon]|nr:cobalamin-dependent protein [Nitrososphaerota archaeon]
MIGKIGLDGHDVGAKVVALGLRDAGFEVIYTGRHRSVEEIIAAAGDEDVDVIGISVLSGTHLRVAKQMIDLMKERGIDIPIIMGGVIPDKDIPLLKKLGVKEVFVPGAVTKNIVECINILTKRK